MAAIPCDRDQTCLDAPDDGCDPDQGGADCAGQCYACDDPGLGRSYVSRDPEECARGDFDCDPGVAGFSDACGCGCG